MTTKRRVTTKRVRTKRARTKKDEVLTTEHLLRSLEYVEETLTAIRWALEGSRVQFAGKVNLPKQALDSLTQFPPISRQCLMIPRPRMCP